MALPSTGRVPRTATVYPDEVLVERRAPRLPKSVVRAAVSPSAVVLAGAGAAVGELAHLGLAVTILLGAVGYGSRLLWAALRRRWARERARRWRQASRVDPWSVPEPWRGYARRAVDALRQLGQLAGNCAPGPVADELRDVAAKCDGSVQELWRLARNGAALAGPTGRTEKVARQLGSVQSALAERAGPPGPGRGAQGANRPALEAQEAALASELRSAHRLDQVAGQVAGRLEALCSQLEGLVAAAGELVLNAGGTGAKLSDLAMQLSALNDALSEAFGALPADGYGAGPGGTGGGGGAAGRGSAPPANQP